LNTKKNASEITFYFKGIIKSDNTGMVFNNPNHETRSNTIYEEILKGLKGENSI